MYPDEEEVQNAMQVFLERSLGNLQGIDSSWLTTAGQLLQQTAPKWLTQRVERSALLCIPLSLTVSIVSLSYSKPTMCLHMPP